MKKIFVLFALLLSSCATPFLTASGKIYERNLQGVGELRCAVIKEISLKELSNGESTGPECWCMRGPEVVSGSYVVTVLLLAAPDMCKK